MSKSPLILVVEDDSWFAQQEVRALEAAGFQALYAPNAVEAMEIIDERRPDVLLLDVFLAGPNVFTLLHELRSHVDLAMIPVVLCTNSADALTEEDLAVYGISAVLDKTSMLPDDIVAAIRRVLP